MGRVLVRASSTASQQFHKSAPQMANFASGTKSLSPERFHRGLIDEGVDFFTGVPDSLLKSFCAYVTDFYDKRPLQHVIAANEGNAISLAMGAHMATGRVPVVYMQNSGFGNSINPLLSLCDPAVYSIPMLIIAGWRGMPGLKDEPQHVQQGAIMLEMLQGVRMPYAILPADEEKAIAITVESLQRIKNESHPFTLLVPPDTFSGYKSVTKRDVPVFPLNREGAIEVVLSHVGLRDIIVSTTGKCSREVYEYRASQGQDHSKDFLTVGGMGHTSSIALGIAMNRPTRQVMCLDGDGSALMHLGALTTAGQLSCKNFKHILLNNGCHDSVGGQPSAGFDVDFCAIAKASGYKSAMTAADPDDIVAKLNFLLATNGPAMLEIRINSGARDDLGRPKSTPLQNRDAFMNFIQTV